MAVLRASLNGGARWCLASSHSTSAGDMGGNAEAGKYARLDLTARFSARPCCRRCARSTCGPRTCRGRRGFRPRCNPQVAARFCARASSRLLFLIPPGLCARWTLCRACGAQKSLGGGGGGGGGGWGGWGGCDSLRRADGGTSGSRNGWCATSAARPSPCPRSAPLAGSEGKMAAVGPGVERIARGGPRACFSRCEAGDPVVGPVRVGAGPQGADRDDRGRRDRYHHRHAAGGQGAQFPAADAWWA